MEQKEIISSGLLEMHVLGMATEEESARVISMSNEFPEVNAELNVIEISMEVYAKAHAIAPALATKQKLLQQINKAPQSTGQQSSAKIIGIAPYWKKLAAASVILFLGSAILNFVYYNKFQTSNTAYKQSQQELLAVNKHMHDMNEDLDVVKNKYSQTVSLNGLAAAPDAAAKIFWMKNTGEVYIDPSNLPETPQGMQYQLWGIVDGKPVDAGMIITTDKENKYRIQKMKSFGKVQVQAFAVTLETAGGNPTPKGEMYVLGEM